MTRVLIGHRGVGKSTLLKRLQTYFPNLKFCDLDQAIEKKLKRSISDIFANDGEEQFRRIEVETLSELIGQYDYISLGAGFTLDAIPSDVEIVWIRRATDSLARVFTNRPRLNLRVSPAQEYMQRFSVREAAYRANAHWDYIMPEGCSNISEIEKNIFSGTAHLNDVMFTLPQNFDKSLGAMKSLNFKKFELRDDILSQEKILELLKTLPAEQILLSFRSRQASVKLMQSLGSQLQSLEWDWALENNAKDISKTEIRLSPILSLHERVDEVGLKASFEKLEALAAPHQHLKLAVMIHNFSELEEGLAWQAADSQRRSFLPRSPGGRWSWVRLYLKGRQKINFIKFLDGSAADQPTPFQWLATKNHTQKFAAVLGSPVFHSWSPEMHREFFASRQMPFWAIDIQEPEWDIAFAVLKKMGLMAAAVTSPLKIRAGGVNTLWVEHQVWQKANTDQVGLEALLSKVAKAERCIVWGGGGTLQVIAKALPQAQFFSARTGMPRDLAAPVMDAASHPHVLLWAASPDAELPPPNFRPRLVIDLNYREDSRAREYAQQLGAEYISGESMFIAQALAQQELWREADLKDCL